MKHKRIRRDKLMRDIEKGLLLGKCDFHYTDDYAWDNACGFGRTELMPCRIRKDRNDIPKGFLSFDRDDFSSSYRTGGAYQDEAGVIHFEVHSNLSYSFAYKYDSRAIYLLHPAEMESA